MCRSRLLLLLALLPIVASLGCQKYVSAMSKEADKSYTNKDIGFYTKGMSVFMRMMIGEIKQETAAEMGNIIRTPEETHSHVMSILSYHPPVTAVFSILILIAIGLFIATIIVFFCRFCNPATEGLTPSKCQMFCTLFVLIFCACICIVGSIVFFLSIDGVKQGITDIGPKLNSTSGQLSSFVKGYHQVMQCLTKDQHTNMTVLMRQKITEIDAKIAALNNEITTVQTLGVTLQSGDPSTFSSNIDSVNKNLSSILTEVSKINSEITKILTQASDAFKKVYNDLTDNIKKVEDGFKQMENQLLEIMTENNYYAGAVSTVMQYLIIIPLILVGIMVYAFVVLFLRFVKNCSKVDQEEKRGALSVCSGYLLGITGYVAMLTGVFLFALAAATFVVAFASMFLCIGFFDDPDLMVFNAFPSLSQSVGNFTIHEAFVRCKNEYPFFDAIDGDKQMAGDILAGVYASIAKKDFCQDFRKFSIDPGFLNSLDAHIQSASGGQSEMQDYFNKLHNLNARAYRDALCLTIDDQLLSALEDLKNLAGDQLNSVLDMSPQCDSMIKIWDNAGSFICNGISMPAQGAWMACAICGVASFTVFHWMFKSTRYLKNFDNTDRNYEETGKKKKRKKHKKRSQSKTSTKSKSKSRSISRSRNSSDCYKFGQ